MAHSIAVVGSGPGGMYAVQGLVDKLPGCQVDVLERLVAPFGLIRGGVAPDHQTTKRVSRAFEKSLGADGVRFLGNVEVGRDVTLAELLEIYDAVVLAYGAPHDNRLGIPGEDKANVFGSNAFVGWYNCHPDFLDLNPDVNVAGVAVIGVGNVAVDVARVLAKTPAEMSVTDLAPYAADAIHAAPIRDVYIFGRRGPWEASFTNVELREMGHLENAAPIVDLAQIPDQSAAGHLDEKELRVRAKNVETLRSFADVPAEGKAKRVHFVFYAQPVEILGGDRVEGVRMERTRVEDGRCIGTGETFDVRCGLVVTCIGSRAAPLETLPLDERRGILVNEGGKVSEGLYAVGWVKRGATGTIGTNKNDSLEVVDRLIAELPAAGTKPGSAALDKLLAGRGARPVSLAEWQAIDRLEQASAGEGAPRRKFLTNDEMLTALAKAQAAE